MQWNNLKLGLVQWLAKIINWPLKHSRGKIIKERLEGARILQQFEINVAKEKIAANSNICEKNRAPPSRS